ncbi:sensor histidine kinase [Lysinibacillus xylanilyticus]|uniref:sensor histidine kinase n=1 Tax=Lysinibacillus xylanilyticus TaxID=582475 RepID=UPI00083C9415|nr:HAMP domain-containing sensor histidine kinase [Lysinibacillus xylanilyticus]
MNKLRKRAFWKSITWKIFVVTTLLLFISAAIIYSTLYFFLPIFYENYKKAQMDTAVKELITDAHSLSFQDALQRLDEFGQKTNAMPFLFNDQQQIVYPNFVSSSGSAVVSGSSVDDISIFISSGSPLTEHSPNQYIITEPIAFKDRVLTLRVNTTLQPINEASQVLLMLIPYIGLFIFFVSVSGALVYSRIVSKPLLAINQAAKKMSNLDFAVKIEHKLTDEIGELSDSLNDMSTKLQRTMQDLKTTNMKLRSEVEKERQIETKRRELFGVISHELKSPITAVKGQLDGMIHEIGIYKDRDTYLRRSYKILENMEHLIHDILHISKFEHQIVSPKSEYINLSALIGAIIKDFDYFTMEKNIRVIIDIEADLFIHTDPKLLEKALKNVIHNAIVYSHSSEQVMIQLKKTESGILKFQVLNTGAHIPEDAFNQIFEPFYRLEKSRNRNTGGSGLGLYIVKMVLEALSINFSMRNTEQGVLFSADIPG